MPKCHKVGENKLIVDEDHYKELVRKCQKAENEVADLKKILI